MQDDWKANIMVLRGWRQVYMRQKCRKNVAGVALSELVKGNEHNTRVKKNAVRLWSGACVQLVLLFSLGQVASIFICSLVFLFCPALLCA